MDDERDETTDATTEPEKSPSTPGPASVPSEGDVADKLPGVPEEAPDRDVDAGEDE